MPIVDIRSVQAAQREIALTDIIMAIGEEDTLAEALRTDTFQQVIRKTFLNVPTDFSDREKGFILQAFGLGDLAQTLQNLQEEIDNLKGQSRPSAEDRYFGWKPTNPTNPRELPTIEASDFTASETASYDKNTGEIPTSAERFAFLWFAVPEANGFPAHVYLGNNQNDYTAFVRQQTGHVVVNTFNYLVGVIARPQGTGIAGQNLILSY